MGAKGAVVELDEAVEGRGLAQTVFQLNGLEQLNQERVPPFYAEEPI